MAIIGHAGPNVLCMRCATMLAFATTIDVALGSGVPVILLVVGECQRGGQASKAELQFHG